MDQPQQLRCNKQMAMSSLVGHSTTHFLSLVRDRRAYLYKPQTHSLELLLHVLARFERRNVLTPIRRLLLKLQVSAQQSCEPLLESCATPLLLLHLRLVLILKRKFPCRMAQYQCRLLQQQCRQPEYQVREQQFEPM